MFCDWTRLFFLRCKEDAWRRKIMQKNNSLSVSFWIWIKLNIWLNRLVCKDTDCIHDQDGNSDCRCILSCLATYTNINHFLLQFSEEWSDTFYSRQLKKKKIQENKTQASLVFNLLLKPELGCICWSCVLILAALSRKTDVTFCREERSASFKEIYSLYVHIRPCKIKVPQQNWPETNQPPHHTFPWKIVSYLDTWAAARGKKK